MALLDEIGVKSYRVVDIPSARQYVSIYDLELSSSSDTLTVPGLQSTSAVGSLTAGITVTAGALTEGQTTLTITGGTKGTRCLVSVAHRKGFRSNLGRDEDPT